MSVAGSGADTAPSAEAPTARAEDDALLERASAPSRPGDSGHGEGPAGVASREREEGVVLGADAAARDTAPDAAVRDIAPDTAAMSLYVHVPFCAARCPYCDFATAPATTRLRGRYLEALAREIREQGAVLGRLRVRTLYVGGGTPSLLDPDEIAPLGEAIASAFDLDLAEATVEANPATLDRARLDAWAALGITRLSLGAQSFSERGLRALGRTHQPLDTATAAQAARSVGLDVSVDLIFGWPGQTLDEWRDDLAAATALGLDHLSCYPLELVLEPEEAVANWPGGGWPSVRRWRERAASGQADDTVLARMYRTAERALRAAGYRHYEIANWAREGKRCAHNLVYWRNGDWLGVGAGAHSHLSGVRSRRPAALAAYLVSIEDGVPRIADPGADAAVDTPILGLRLDEGLDLDAYERHFGVSSAARVRTALRDASALGLVRLRNDRATLTPRGRLLASEVFVRLLPDPPRVTRASGRASTLAAS